MPWWVWGLLGLAALVGETLSLSLFLLNVAIAAFVAAILAYFQVQVAVQVGVFVVLSVALVTLARPRLVALLLGRTPERLTTLSHLVGRIATVTEPITLDAGTIRVGKAEFWTARANHAVEPVGVGRQVRIERVDGLTAYVDPLAPAEREGGPLDASSISEPEPAGLDAAGALQVASFGALLKGYRVAANLTQEALAERAGLSERAISDLERGLHRTPQRDTVHMLSDALGLAPRDRDAFESAARQLHAASHRIGS